MPGGFGEQADTLNVKANILLFQVRFSRPYINTTDSEIHRLLSAGKKKPDK
jgi:hypothetical protein